MISTLRFLFCYRLKNLLAKIERSKETAPPGGVEPPTFRLTAERANHCATEALYKIS